MIRIQLLASACFLLASWLQAASLSGTVKDPSGAVVAGAEVSLQRLPQGAQLHTTTDAQGRFGFAEAAAGSYNLQVEKAGFEPSKRSVTVADKPLDVSVSLKLRLLTETVTVSGKRSPLANSDPNYVALRRGKLTQVYRVHNLVLTRDVGAFTFRSGSFSFLPPVLGQVVTGVFVGDGNFGLKPASGFAVQHLRRIAGIDSVDEDFTALVVYFSDATFEEIKQHSELADESPDRHEQALQRIQGILQHRREPTAPLTDLAGAVMNALTPLEQLLNYEDIPNYEAEILAELYNPAQRGSFRAFLHGRKHADLRFLLNPRGAMPMLPAPEETALLNFDPASETDGVWYLSHLAGELVSGSAGSHEDKRLVAPEQYRIEAFVRKPDALGKMPDLLATCDLRFRSLDEGTRMVKFDLFPNLQVSRVAWNGKDIPFIQESRKQDGSFYLQMPEPLVKGHTYQVSFEYSGGEILQASFGAVPPRRIWYPTPAGPASRATYDLTFRVPRGMTIVSVGKQVKQTREGAFDVSEWSSEVPITQAVFRYLGEFFGKTVTEETTRMDLSAYVEAPPPAHGLPPPVPQGPLTPEQVKTAMKTGSMAAPARRGGIMPASRNDILIDTGNCVRVFTDWFGAPAYSHLSVVVGPTADSLPGLVYALPMMTNNWASLMAQGIRLPPVPYIETVLDEAFSLQVSGQWWGNTVSRISFHDSWLSSGLANFSASLYDTAVNPDDFRDHWRKAREDLLHPPMSFLSTLRPIDVGPLWMGVLNDTYKTRGAGYLLGASKGGYVLNMLRSMMWDSQAGDADFRAMLQDFVKQFANQAVSTEDFKSVVEKHMKPAMDLDGNHHMDWFFNEWVYGTDIPSYRLEYSLTAEEGGKRLLTGTLTQGGVSPGFKMLVPLFAEYADKKFRICVASMRGNSSADFKLILPEEPKRILLNLNYDVLTDKEEVKMMK